MFGTIEQALKDLQAGKFIVVADDEDRENEGDLICAAEYITPQMVNFLMRAKGMICVALSPDRVAQLGLTMMGHENTDALRTAYTVTVDAASKHGMPVLRRASVLLAASLAARAPVAAATARRWLASVRAEPELAFDERQLADALWAKLGGGADDSPAAPPAAIEDLLPEVRAFLERLIVRDDP